MKQYNIQKYRNGYLVERGDRQFSGGGFVSGGGGGAGAGGDAFFFPSWQEMGDWIARDLSGGAGVGLSVPFIVGGMGGGGPGSSGMGGTGPTKPTKRKAKK